MALEQSLDRGKTIETKAEEKEKKSYLRQLCERLHLDPAKDYSREDADLLELSDRERKFLVEKTDCYERSKKQKTMESLNTRNEEKKSYLWQLCERLHLDPAKDYPKEKVDLLKKIDYYERLNKQKSMKSFDTRSEEIINIIKTHEDRCNINSLSQRILSIEWIIAEDLKYIGILRLTNNEAAKNFLYPFIESGLKKKVAMRRKLIDEYQSMLQNNR